MISNISRNTCTFASFFATFLMLAEIPALLQLLFPVGQPLVALNYLIRKRRDPI